jgi:hypothetical protein
MAEQGHASHATAPTDGAGEHFESHGHSLASWILVVLVLIGTFVASLGIVLSMIWLIVVGAVVVVAGLIVGRVLQMAGFGVHPPSARSN